MDRFGPSKLQHTFGFIKVALLASSGAADAKKRSELLVLTPKES